MIVLSLKKNSLGVMSPCIRFLEELTVKNSVLVIWVKLFCHVTELKF